MGTGIDGFLSCVLAADTPNELQEILIFANHLKKIHRDFEIIVCATPNLIESDLLVQACIESENLAIYEISSSSKDLLFTAGLELALGDWILELPNNASLIKDFQNLFNLLEADSTRTADSYQIISNNFNFVDYFLSLLASVALEVPVHTMVYAPRLTKRVALQTWNTRKLRSKVLRVAPQLDRSVVLAKRVDTKSTRQGKRFTRTGLRTLIHSSAKPLRWVSFLSLAGAFISVVISFTILLVGMNHRVVPGWTTTNLQISSLSFLILLVLGVLTEYIYQITAAAIDQPSFRVVQEYMSNKFSFNSELNVEIGVKPR